MILDRFREAVEANGLLVAGDRILAAVSGGSDSVALVRLLADYARRVPLTILVAHVNHRLRGAAAEADQRFVEDLAARLGLACDVVAPEREEEIRRVRQGEEGARRVRHALLSRAARSRGCSRIALGHTMDDQAETVLMRLARGAGRRGLSGMSWAGPGRLIRPMLGIAREEARGWLDRLGQPFREDESNLDLRFLRNKVRIRLLPLLAELNPAIVRTLARNATVLAEEDAYLDKLAAEWATSQVSSGPGGIRLRAEALEALPKVVARRAARLALKRAGADPRGASLAAVEELLRLAEPGAPDLPGVLPGGLMVVRSGPDLAIGRPGGTEGEGGERPAFDVTLQLPGIVVLPGQGGELTARIVPRGALPALPAGPRQAALDADRLGTLATVRTRVPGDTFHPLGAPGHRKLKEFLIDCKVPRSMRGRVPLVVGPEGIAWVVGVRIGHEYRVTPATRSVAVLEYTGGWI